jgi:hypothetical protein
LAGTPGTSGSSGFSGSSGVSNDLNFSIKKVINDYNILTTDYTIIGQKGTDFNINLPTGVTGQIFVVKNFGIGVITLNPVSGETIDDNSYINIYSPESYVIQFLEDNGWMIISKYYGFS